MLGGRDGRAVGRVADRDPAPGRRGDVDRVVADPGPRDDHQARGAVHGGIAERRRPDDRRDGRVDAGVWVVGRGRPEDRAPRRDGSPRARGGPGARTRPRGAVVAVMAPTADRRAARRTASRAARRTPTSTANSPPAIGLARVDRVGPAAPDRRDEQGRAVRAAERRHRRFVDRHADPPVDRAGRRDPEDHPAHDAGDPVAPGLVDGTPRPAGPAAARSRGRPARWWPRPCRRRSRTPRRCPGGCRRSTSSGRRARTRGRWPRRCPSARSTAVPSGSIRWRSPVALPAAAGANIDPTQKRPAGSHRPSLRRLPTPSGSRAIQSRHAPDVQSRNPSRPSMATRRRPGVGGEGHGPRTSRHRALLVERRSRGRSDGSPGRRCRSSTAGRRRDSRSGTHRAVPRPGGRTSPRGRAPPAGSRRRPGQASAGTRRCRPRPPSGPRRPGARPSATRPARGRTSRGTRPPSSAAITPAMSTPPCPSGTNSPSMTDSRKGTSPLRTWAALAGSRSLRWTWRTRPRAARATSTGSVPAR